MRWRIALLSSICTAAAASSIAADPPAASVPTATTVFGKEVDGTAPGALLAAHLRKALQPHFEARKRTIEAITTPEQVLNRKEYVRAHLAALNGPFPEERTDLHPRVMGTLARDGYRIEKVVFESRPGHHVTANAYVPSDVKGKVPGVIVPCGHSAEGKGAEAYQSICVSLARRGMIALIYDPIGQGERHQLLGPNGKPAIQGVSEHNQIGIGAWLVGLGTANYRIWDGIRALDYLASRPDVDAKRLGCTGNSGGGTLTSYLMAFDERIAAAAPSCYLTTFERLIDTIGPQDAEQNFPGQIAAGLDHADFLIARAPQPTLMCTAIRDYFDIGGARTTHAEARRLYGILGKADACRFFEFDDTHGFSAPRREAAMRFLRRELVGAADDPAEGTLVLSPKEELLCTTSGEVLAEFDGERSVFDLTKERARRLARQRQNIWHGPEMRGARYALLERIAVDRKVFAGEVRVESVGKSELPALEATVEKLVLRREGEPPLPALLVEPRRNAAGDGTRVPLTIVVSDRDKSVECGPEGEAGRLVKSGRRVLAVDLRGFGETRPTVSGQYGDHPKGEYGAALLSLHLAKPLLGQRVVDLATCMTYAAGRKDADPERLDVVAVGAAGPIALHAACLDGRIGRVELVRSVRSWFDVLDAPLVAGHLQNVVPGALETYDLTDLTESIGPQRVTFR